jgi:hypothetical protein
VLETELAPASGAETGPSGDWETGSL